MVQKSIGFGRVKQPVAGFLEVGAVDLADRVLDCATGKRRQTGEVVPAFE